MWVINNVDPITIMYNVGGYPLIGPLGMAECWKVFNQ